MPAHAQPASLDSLLAAEMPRLVELRRELHAWPEPGFEEVETARRVVDHLRDLPGLQLRTGLAGTGVTALLGADKPGPCVALRADMDCLPMDDACGRPWASRRPGFCHACGHDGHTAALVGAARLLARLSDELTGPVKFIFQPAEESKGGGRHMVEAGVLSDPPVAAIFGLHGFPTLTLGTAGYAYGSMLAASDAFRIVVSGRGTHAAMPHLGVDPIVIAAHLITALQTLVSRETDPLDSAVITVGKIQAGTAINIIPSEAVLEGTIRTLREEVRERTFARLTALAAQLATGLGGHATTEIRRGYPVCRNHPSAVDFLRHTAATALAPHLAFHEVRPVMGGEDFAFYAEKVPAAFFFLGTCPPGESNPALLHQSHYDFNDDALPLAVRAHVEIARRFSGLPPPS